MRRHSPVWIVGIVAVVLAACPSAPPTPEPAKPEPPKQEDPTVGAAITPRLGLTDEEIKEVEAAIRAAEELGAERFAPSPLTEARDGLATARRQDTEGKLDEARQSLTQAREAALRAQREARQGALAAERKRLDDAHDLLLGINAHRYTPNEYQALKADYDQAIAVIDSEDLAQAKSLTHEVVGRMLDHRDRLETRLQALQGLRIEARRAIDQAEANNAAILAPKELEDANTAYLQGLSRQRQFDLPGAENSFTQARYLAQVANQRVRGGADAQRTQALMDATRQAIERASRLTVVDENNNVIRPQPWDANKALEERRRQQQQQQPQEQPPQEQPQSLRLVEGTVAVLQETGRVTYLTLAQEAWLKGVEEKERGNFAVADDYFREALRLVQLYESLAVDKIYTVRLIPERRDCLWRIAEYPDIYGDPLLWPLIWYRNRRLIQNPDLIFPGWQLVIPPR